MCLHRNDNNDNGSWYKLSDLDKIGQMSNTSNRAAFSKLPKVKVSEMEQIVGEDLDGEEPPGVD